jgi:hypothetical protein
MSRNRWSFIPLLTFVTLVYWSTLAAQNRPEASVQVERGKHYFEASPKGLACATCHAIDGVGTPVAPDLRRLSGAVSPHDLMRTIEMVQTVFVQEIQTRDGRIFPGIQKQIEGNVIEVWDLSRTPAMLLKLKPAEIISMEENRTWKHPPASADYTKRELADIIGFLKWAASGEEKEITPADLK